MGQKWVESMFPETEWTELRAAFQTDGKVDPVRIEILCTNYYEPISSFIRSICPRREEAEDLTQGFVAGLAEGKYLNGVNRDSGKFRSFLCKCAQNFARSQWRRSGAQKRGGNAEHVAFDENAGNASVQPAEDEFDRAWVKALIERTMKSLKREYERRDSAVPFDLLAEGLEWTSGDRSGAELAELAGMTRGAFATAVHRLKTRFADHVRQEVRQIVTTEEEAEEELRHYLGLFPGS